MLENSETLTHPSPSASKVLRSAIASVVTGETRFSVTRLFPFTISVNLPFAVVDRKTKKASLPPLVQPTLSATPSLLISKDAPAAAVVKDSPSPATSIITGSNAAAGTPPGTSKLNLLLISASDLAFVKPSESTA